MALTADRQQSSFLVSSIRFEWPPWSSRSGRGTVPRCSIHWGRYYLRWAVSQT